MNSTKCSCVNASSFASRLYLRLHSRVTMPVPRWQLRKALRLQSKGLVLSFLTSPACLFHLSGWQSSSFSKAILSRSASESLSYHR